MANTPRITLILAILVLLLTFANWFTAENITPYFERAEVLAALSSVGLMLIATLWAEISPTKPNKSLLKGNQGLEIDENLNNSLKKELGWGSHLILTSTAAATILVWWEGKAILRRGLLGSGKFVPGDICKRAKKSGKIVSLVKTKLYPGSYEFDPILDDLPSIIIFPIDDKGFIILGGYSERCFSKSDEKWIEGWTERLKEVIYL